MSRTPFALVTMLAACSGPIDDKTDTDTAAPSAYTTDTGIPVADVDGDGFTTDVDCDDDNAAIFPGALDICDRLDNDCDGWVDEAAATVDGITNYATVDEAMTAALLANNPVLVDLCGSNDLISLVPVRIGDGQEVVVRGVAGRNGTRVSTVGAPTFTVLGTGSLTVDGITLHGSRQQTIVKVQDSGKLTLRNARVEDSQMMGVYLRSFGPVATPRITLENTEVLGNVGRAGNALYLEGQFEAAIRDSVITGNGDSGSPGGGIYASGAGTVTLQASVVTRNEGNQGGGIYAVGVAIVLLGSEVLDNYSPLQGGGVFLGGGATLTGDGASTITGNQAMAGGGIYVADGSVQNIVLDDNGADEGGGIYVNYSLTPVDPITLDDVQLLNHSSDRGGALFVGINRTVILPANASVLGNQATVEGGGAYLEGTGSTLVSQGATWSDAKSGHNDAHDVAFVSGTTVTFAETNPTVSCTHEADACEPL